MGRHGSPGVGNGEYRGALGRAGEAIRAYIQAHGHRLAQTLVRLDGQYGNGAIVVDLADLPYVMRGKDYHLLALPEVQARLTRPPDFRTTHPETGTTRALYDGPTTAITATGETCRMIVATHPAATTPAPGGTTREKIVYELFFTALPQAAFTAADVVALAPPIVVPSRRSEPLRISSKIPIAGGLIRSGDRRDGRFAHNGSGISALSVGASASGSPAAPHRVCRSTSG